jgi:hypothetical protein
MMAAVTNGKNFKARRVLNLGTNIRLREKSYHRKEKLKWTS